MTTEGTKSKEYIRPMPSNWWLKRKSYFLFMIRELTCLFVGGYALFLLVLASRIDDPGGFSLLTHPLVIALQVIALPMVVYHTVTWLNLTPKVLVVWRGETRVSPVLIAGVHYLAWFGVSAVVLWIVLK
jgi:fumarate reductase subunit C